MQKRDERLEWDTAGKRCTLCSRRGFVYVNKETSIGQDEKYRQNQTERIEKRRQELKILFDQDGAGVILPPLVLLILEYEQDLVKKIAMKLGLYKEYSDGYKRFQIPKEEPQWDLIGKWIPLFEDDIRYVRYDEDDIDSSRWLPSESFRMLLLCWYCCPRAQGNKKVARLKKLVS
jgi:hypothetical protein